MANKCFLGIAAAASLAMYSQVSAAGGFDYTFAEGGYRNIDGDNYSGDGAQVGLSFGATDYLHIVATYSRLWVDDIEGASDVDVDLDAFTIGFGSHYSFTDKFDLAGTVVYVDDEYTGKARPDNLGYKTRINESEEGYEATMYGRIQVLKNLEMTPHVVYRDVEDSETGFGLGLVYDLTKKFAIRARATSFNGDNDTTNLFLGMRLYM